MLKPILLALALTAPASQRLSLKDTPEPETLPITKGMPMPEAARHPYVYVQGFYDQRFYVPVEIMRRYGLLPEQIISVTLARRIVAERGWSVYSPQMLRRLERLDEQERRRGAP